MSEGEREARGTTYRCGVAARWLPRALAGSILVSVLPVLLRSDPDSRVAGSGPFHTGLILLVALVGLWVLRRGGELRLVIEIRADRMLFGAGSRQAELRFSQIDALRYEAPFAATRTWLPATVLIDRDGTCWRLSALLERGHLLIEELLARSGREDLAAWVDALNVRGRMAESSRRVGPRCLW